MELPKTFDAKEAQTKWLAHWNEKNYFRSEPDDREPYTIVIPPPNVTGALHMGHALNNTLQDVLIRWRRMQGRNALWMPGTDHAGIATQAVVERLIFQSEKKTRHDLGREELVKRIWEWKDKYEARIVEQLKQLGCSCDWERIRFTLDDQCAKAVRETFFNMFRDGYIYRGKRLVNWDPHLQTSVADDETYTEDTKGGFWTFKYEVIDEARPSRREKQYIQFSTTRPETMFGDTALCVHPSDERYQALIGKHVLQPLVNRKIPIIADGLLADPELGTGCVKVTPAHDPNDYTCWQRNPSIGIINILNPDGTINSEGGAYQGQDRFKAREAVVKAMEELGLYEGKEDRVIPLKYSDRSKSPIEPYLSAQWFVRMNGGGGKAEGGGRKAEGEEAGLAQMAIEAVLSDRVKFFPERYKNAYLDWLGEKRDWCISRQLWWGHRIPVWTRKCTDDEDYQWQITTWKQTRNHWIGECDIIPDAENLTIHVCILNDNSHSIPDLEGDAYFRSDEVLDTWFSSALWPYSTLGWPEKTPELDYYYPTSTLCTSRDIITLWVARMVLTGLYNVGEIPFHEVYVHPKMLDGFGETMSKSKGNGIDPLDIIELYGTDALRYAMVNLATETQDSRLPVVNVCPHCSAQVPVKQEHMYMRTKKLACPACKKEFRPGGPWPIDDTALPTAKQGSDKFELGRNFANKIWNATRFILMNLEGYTPGEIDIETLAIEDRWIVSRLATTANRVTEKLEGYHFAEVAKLIYDFVWNEFCDWYIEMSKSRRSDPVCQRVLVGVLDGILRLIHPIMPFVSESLWHALGEVAPERGLPFPAAAEESCCIAKWPHYSDVLIDVGTETGIARMQELVRGIREIRNRYSIDKEPLDVMVRCSASVADDLAALSPFIVSLGQLKSLECGPTVLKPKQAATLVNPEFEAYVALAGLIDPAVEAKRLEKQIEQMRKTHDSTNAKLANESFTSKAPPEVVQQQRDLVSDLAQQMKVLQANLAELLS